MSLVYQGLLAPRGGRQNKHKHSNTNETQVAESLCKDIRGNNTRVPSSATICRTRARVDAAYMLHVRAMIDEYVHDHVGAAIYAMADKSPQGGREYEQVVLDIVKRCMLGKLQCLIQEMESRRARSANYECARVCACLLV